MEEGSMAPGLAHILGLEDTSLLRKFRMGAAKHGPKVSTPTSKSRTILNNI